MVKCVGILPAHAGSLKSARVGVFTPQKLAEAATQALRFSPLEQVPSTHLAPSLLHQRLGKQALGFQSGSGIFMVARKSLKRIWIHQIL